MVFHMKTTLVIDDQVMTRLREEAARQGRTLSELVEAALRRMLEAPTAAGELPPLPTFRGGRARVDVADREALYSAMEGPSGPSGAAQS
jgi:hypothetical protein